MDNYHGKILIVKQDKRNFREYWIQNKNLQMVNKK